MRKLVKYERKVTKRDDSNINAKPLLQKVLKTFNDEQNLNKKPSKKKQVCFDEKGRKLKLISEPSILASQRSGS